MIKVFLAAATGLTLCLSAAAQDKQVFEGDQNFLANAYADAEDGTDFSYASQWGSGRAYDGTDTSRFLPHPESARPAPPQNVRRDTVTRRVQAQPRQTLPASKPQPPVVNTMRTITQPAPQLRGSRNVTTRTVQQPRQKVTRQHAPQRSAASNSPLQQVPNARPGECYARMKTPAQYSEVPRQITTAAPYKRARVQQAVFESDRKQVLVKDGFTKYVVTQPRFETRNEDLTVKPAYDRLEVVPARFAYTNETVKVSEPRLVWKRGVGLSGVSRIDPRTGDTWCLVEEAGETKTLRKRIVTHPEQVRKVHVPAQTVSVPRQVLIAPAQVKEVKVPAQYRDFNVQRMTQPARAETYQAPAEFGTVMTKVLRVSASVWHAPPWIPYNKNHVGPRPILGTV